MELYQNAQQSTQNHIESYSMSGSIGVFVYGSSLHHRIVYFSAREVDQIRFILKQCPKQNGKWTSHQRYLANFAWMKVPVSFAPVVDSQACCTLRLPHKTTGEIVGSRV